MLCKYVYNEISGLKHGQKVVRLYLPVCLITCEALKYLQQLGILTLGTVHEASATWKS